MAGTGSNYMVVVAHLEVHLQRGEVEDRRELERQRVKHGPQFEVRVEDQEVDEPEDVYRLVYIFEGGKITMRGDKLVRTHAKRRQQHVRVGSLRKQREISLTTQ